MNNYLARENIRRFKQKLRTSSDEKQRAILRRLIDAEQQKVETILEDKLKK